MPVIIQYVVERDGEAKMTFASKQQADAYDKMLDLAELMGDLLGRSQMLNDNQTELLSLYLAQNKDELLAALQGKAKAVKKQKDEEGVLTEPSPSEPDDSAEDTVVTAFASAA
ncbi:MAG: YebG family protein [Chromatiaceae bacterium]|jgi:dsDNA-binding SOS-regulon protein